MKDGCRSASTEPFQDGVPAGFDQPTTRLTYWNRCWTPSRFFPYDGLYPACWYYPSFLGVCR